MAKFTDKVRNLLFGLSEPRVEAAFDEATARTTVDEPALTSGGKDEPEPEPGLVDVEVAVAGLVAQDVPQEEPEPEPGLVDVEVAVAGLVAQGEPAKPGASADGGVDVAGLVNADELVGGPDPSAFDGFDASAELGGGVLGESITTAAEGAEEVEEKEPADGEGGPVGVEGLDEIPPPSP